MAWADVCFWKTLYWLKLSNSGDTLKLMIPSYSRKAISGQINSLGTVTSQVMNESKMGYRGSKSVFMKQAKYMHRPLNYTVNYLLCLPIKEKTN